MYRIKERRQGLRGQSTQGKTGERERVPARIFVLSCLESSDPAGSRGQKNRPEVEYGISLHARGASLCQRREIPDEQGAGRRQKGHQSSISMYVADCMEVSPTVRL